MKVDWLLVQIGASLVCIGSAFLIPDYVFWDRMAITFGILMGYAWGRGVSPSQGSGNEG